MNDALENSLVRENQPSVVTYEPDKERITHCAQLLEDSFAEIKAIIRSFSFNLPLAFTAEVSQIDDCAEEQLYARESVDERMKVLQSLKSRLLEIIELIPE